MRTSSVNSVVKPSLAQRIAAMAQETDADAGLLYREYADFDKFVAQRFGRLDEAQQRVVLAAVRADETTHLGPVLEGSSRDPEVPLAIRVEALETLENLGYPVDSGYLEALRKGAEVARQLDAEVAPELDDAEMLTAPLDAAVRALPVPLAVDVARQAATGDLTRALAVLRTVRPQVETVDLPALVGGLAAVPLTGSAMMLQDILADSPPKALQKSVKKALHRLKSRGVIFGDSQAPRQVVLGNSGGQLKRCLASFIDATGDRMVLMIRTRPGGGYQVAYLVLNYGTGIRLAKALQASRRELPEMLESVQAEAPLIELEPAHCQRQIALVQQLNLATRTPVPEEFFMLRDIIGESDSMPETGAIYEALSAEELEMARAQDTHAGDLLKLPELAGWTLPESVVREYADALAEIDESKIVVSEAMKRERVDRVFESAMREVLGEGPRAVMRLRLEETAYYFLQTGRRVEAMWALGAAESLLNDNPERLRVNPFAGALLERSLESAKRTTGNRIVMPFSAPSEGTPSQPDNEPRLII
jgi:hypothetical protein